MSVESVITKIGQKASVEAEGILAEGARRAEKRSSEILKTADSRVEATLSRAKSQAELISRSARQQATITGRIGVLNAKREALSTVRGEAVKLLEGLDDSRWSEIYTKLVTENAPEGDFTLAVPERYEQKYLKKSAYAAKQGTDGSIVEYWSALIAKKTGKKPVISVKANPEVSDGLRIEGQFYDVDLCHAAVIGELFENNEKRIADVLFGERS